MKDFRIEAIVQTELEEAAGWYETQREGLGFEFIAEIDRVFVRITHEPTFPTAPITTVEGVLSVVSSSNDSHTSSVFVETDDERRVIMIRRGSSDPARWQGRL